MTIQGPGNWNDEGVDEAEDLGALGVSVKEAGVDEDLETVLEEEPAVLGVVEDKEEPLNELARLEALEKELDEPPIEIGQEEEE